MTTERTSEEVWEESFEEQIERQAYNTAPVEALVRNVSYYLRDRYSLEEQRELHFLEMGCGTGPNLLWLARKGVKVSGVDISPTALELAKKVLKQGGCADRMGTFVHASVGSVPLEDASCDGIIEACVLQHVTREDRLNCFSEIYRLLKPGGVFVGYMLSQEHTIYQQRKDEEEASDPGTIHLEKGGSKIHISNIGLTHFYARDELLELLKPFSVADPCETTYRLPKEEAGRRGFDDYLQGMWTVYAIK